MLSREEVAWAGGLFDGEGCFTRAGERGYAVAQLRMTDLDSVDRFARAVGFGNRFGPEAQPGRPTYGWRVSGLEQVQALVAMLWPFLNERRRQRAKEVLNLNGTRKEAT